MGGVEDYLGGDKSQFPDKFNDGYAVEQAFGMDLLHFMRGRAEVSKSEVKAVDLIELSILELAKTKCYILPPLTAIGSVTHVALAVYVSVKCN